MRATVTVLCRRSKGRRLDPPSLSFGWQAERGGYKQDCDLEIQFHVALVLLSGARSVERHIGLRFARLRNLVVDQISLDFFAAHVSQHLPIDLDAGRERLAAFAFHFPTEGRILNDVLLRVFQIVFGENSAHAGAPATISLEISGNLRCLHFGKDSTRTKK